MLPVFGVDGDLRCGPERELIAGHILFEVDHSECSAALSYLFNVYQYARRLELPGRDCVQHNPHFALEHAPRHRIECDLSLVGTGLSFVQADRNDVLALSLIHI